MLELQNDDIYELVIDNSYFIFIGKVENDLKL